MISDSTFPQRFTKVDALTRPDHGYLTEDDDCYFIGEYTARQGFAYSFTNNLILNFKKSMDRRDCPEWPYKIDAIMQAAAAFRTALDEDALNSLTFVPVPPSKVKGHTLYDDRLTKMLHAIRPNPKLDVREIIVQKVSTDAVHDSEVRPTPQQLKELYELNESLTTPEPNFIAIVDDVLTTGAHFRTAKTVLSSRFPATPIVGLFIARRVPDMFDFDNVTGVDS